MAITVQQSSASGSGTGTAVGTSFASPTTTGNGVVVVVNYGSNTLTSVTDNQGNTYTLADVGNFFGAHLAAVYHCDNPTGNAALTVTANFSGSTACEIQAFEVRGQLTLDVHSSSSGNAANAQAGPITTTGADRVAFVGLHKTGSTITAPTGYAGGYTSGNGGAAYRVYTSTQTGIDPQWTTTAGTPFGVVIAAFSSTNTTSDASDSVGHGFRLGVGLSAGALYAATVSKGFGLGASVPLIPDVRVGFSIGSDTSFLATDQFGLMTAGIGIGSRPLTDIHELANGRYRR